jgi:AraC-like DNA-binding protein
MRQVTDTRGILRPAAVDRLFSLERPAPPADLAHLVDHHWVVSWDLRGRPPFASEVMPHPAVHLVFEPDGAAVHGVPRGRFDRVLSGTGWALGTKFLPAGFAPFAGRPMHELTGAVVELGTLFGADGARLARAVNAATTHDERLARLHAFLRERLPAPADPKGELVDAAVADMRIAAPGTTVGQIAARHHVSTRTLQRLFRHYVGVGPKWVLQRYRLHDAIEQLADKRGTDWTDFALGLGYFDHAHFIADFRAVVGRSPSQYEAELGATSTG